MEANGNETVGRLAQVIMDQQKEIDNLKRENKGLLALAGRFETELVQERERFSRLVDSNNELRSQVNILRRRKPLSKKPKNDLT